MSLFAEIRRFGFGQRVPLIFQGCPARQKAPRKANEERQNNRRKTACRIPRYRVTEGWNSALKTQHFVNESYRHFCIKIRLFDGE